MDVARRWKREAARVVRGRFHRGSDWSRWRRDRLGVEEVVLEELAPNDAKDRSCTEPGDRSAECKRLNHHVHCGESGTRGVRAEVSVL